MKKEKKQVFIPKGIFYHIGSFLLFYLVAIPVLFIVNIFLGVRIKGRKNLKAVKKTGGVTIANHIFALDCEIVAFALLAKRPWFLMHYWSFDIPVAGMLARLLGGVPTVKNKIKDTKRLFDELETEIHKGRIVHIFPEGESISYDRNLRPFFKGAFRLSINTKTPIGVMLFSYRKRSWFARIFFKKPALVLNVFPPVYPTENEAPDVYMNRVFEMMHGYQKELENGK